MKRFALVLGLILGTVIGSTNVKADGFVYSGHKMVIAGTSTLHDWKAPANKMKAKGDLTLNGSELTGINSLWVETDALSIKSEKGESMDEKIYEALKTDEAPKITFKLTKVKSITKKGNDWIVDASGTLTIAGKTNPVDMTVKAVVNGDGSIVFTGEHKVTMTKYGMERPTAMLGVIKCGDDVTLSFTLTMKRG